VLYRPNAHDVVLWHSLYDGLSLSQFLSDLISIYHGNEPYDRPDFSLAVPHLHREDETASRFWIEQLRGYEPLYLAPQSSTDEKSRSPACYVERRSTLSVAEMEKRCRELEITSSAAAQFAW
jgi:hypothetical protein